MPLLPVSLVVPTHNRAASLVRLLGSLENLKPGPQEIILVNDGSSDRTASVLESWEHKKDLIDQPERIAIHLPTPHGPATARNSGISAASHQIIAFTDDDAVVTPRWIYWLTRHFLDEPEKYGMHTCLCGVGGLVLPLRRDLLSRYYEDQKILDPPRRLTYLVTVNCCFLKNCLEDVGLFDSSFPVPGGEDTDISLRLHRLHYRFAREKKALVYHDFSPNFWHFCEMWIRYGKGTRGAVQNGGVHS